jgi:hypothetical protein
MSELSQQRALALTNDPATLGYPKTLPIEVALKTASIKTICESYGITKDEWNELRYDEAFIADVRKAKTMLEQEGMSFKLKAALQAEELLKTSWKMIHASNNEVPAAVKADLLKFTIRAAGLDGSADKSGLSAGNNLQININLG